MTESLVSWGEGDVAVFVREHLVTAVYADQERLREDLGKDAAVGEMVELVDPDSVARLEREARAFVDENRAALERWLDPDHAGYDLWMTRAREGVGFWARALSRVEDERVFSAWARTQIGDRTRAAEFSTAMDELTERAHKLGGEDGLYVGDDGKLYLA